MTDPVADPAQTIVAGNLRVAVLTERLLRIEHAADGVFEDRATLAVVNRRFPPVPFTSSVDGDVLTVDTGAISLRCTDVTRPPSDETLSATIDVDGTSVTWRFGQEPVGNLGGTVRTLDGWRGDSIARVTGFDAATGFVTEWDPQPLGPGLLSRDGWVVVDDSASVVLTPEPVEGSSGPWPVPRPPGARSDLYLFGHGHDHRRAIADGARLLGGQPLPPRYAFGYWCSRYYPYTDVELEEVVDTLDRHDVPVDVLVVDMDWHRPGWTGYSWDRDLIPDPTGLLRRLHDRGLRVALNLHPADGIGPHEDAFAEVCEAMGLDPATTDRVPFAPTDPRFVDAYLRILHHPEEDRGVDIWWLDWQQGTDTDIPGLDPLSWLNQIHWDDQVRRRPDRRPLLFSRWDGLGAARRPIGFSGDTIAVWESLAFQPRFTATAANVLYGYWSHDIGGHFGGDGDPELYTRWVQLGVHSPILRTHGSAHVVEERRIDEYPNPFRSVMAAAVRRRYELVPYIYGACRRGVDDGSSLVRPMYHDNPRTEAAYQAPDQFLFGPDLIVAPALTPRDDDGRTPVRVWLPRGRWYDTAHGRTVTVDDEGAWAEGRYLLDEVPVLARAGSVVPGQAGVRRLDAPCYPNLVVTAHPGADGAADLHEDDGQSLGHLRGEEVRVPLHHRVTDAARSVAVGPAEGDYAGWEQRRPVEVRLVGEPPPRSVTVDGAEVPWAPAPTVGHWWFDAATATVVVDVGSVDLRAATEVAAVRRPVDEHRGLTDLLDGFPGLVRRLRAVADDTRLLVDQDDRSVMVAARTAERVSAAPETLRAELEALPGVLAHLDALIGRAVVTWTENESLEPRAEPVATTALARARRLLDTAG